MICFSLTTYNNKYYFYNAPNSYKMDYVIGIGIFIFLIYIGTQINKRKQAEQESLRKNYAEALKGTDKEMALMFGRAYYRSLRKPKELTIYDEQAIANDLSTMKM